MSTSTVTKVELTGESVNIGLVGNWMQVLAKPYKER